MDVVIHKVKEIITKEKFAKTESTKEPYYVRKIIIKSDKETITLSLFSDIAVDIEENQSII